MHLTAAEIAAYHENGYHFPVRVFSLEETLDYRRRLEAVEAAAENPAAGRAGIHITQPWAWDLVHDPRIVDPISDVLGPNVLLWSMDWFIKEPGGRYVSYHQDATYWGLEPHHVASAWVALSDAGPATGPMKFIPGSHRGPILEQTDTFAEDNMLSRGQVITAEVDEARAVLAPLAAGEMSIHHVRIIHASEPNTTADRRIGMVLRYCATDVRQTKVEGDRAVLVRGVDAHRHFDLIERPGSADGAAENAVRRAHHKTRHRALHSADYE